MRSMGIRLLIAFVACLLALPITSGPAAAQQPLPPGPWGDFYEPPMPLPGGANGDIIKTQPSFGLAPATATRIMYLSRDTHGNSVPVSGTVYSPGIPWLGNGPRPLVALAPGTQGQGRQCAPSMTNASLLQYYPPFDLMAGYELTFANLLLTEGIAVVITDYIGLGAAAGVHPYVNRRASGQAVLDSARAALKLPGTGLAPNSPIGLWGYSQGGGAAGAAAELQASYAPELNLVGAYVGAPPADLNGVLTTAEGSLLVGVVGFALNSFINDYPQIRPIVDRYINPRGRDVLNGTARMCVAEILQYGLQTTNVWTSTGQTIGQIIAAEPVLQQVINEQRIGMIAPKIPVMLVSNTNDDLVANPQVRQLGGDWCARGARVQYSEIALPPLVPRSVVGHALPALPANIMGDVWMLDRFNGVPAPSNCL